MKIPSKPDLSNVKNKFSGIYSIKSIVSGIGKQIQEITMKLPPLNILAASPPSSKCFSLLASVFGSRYFDPDHFFQFKENIVCYREKNHPLCIYQAELLNDSHRELEGCLDLIHTCAQKAETALHLLIYYLGNDAGEIKDWEYRALLQLSSEQDIPLVVFLDSQISVETLRYTEKFLKENCLATYILLNSTEDFCSKIQNLLPVTETQNPWKTILPPSSVQDTFIHLERLDYSLKQQRIKTLISRAAAATAAEAAVSPIPDWMVMAPTEAVMMAGINSYFEITVSQRIIKTLIPAVLGTGAATIAGKTASDILGRIPILTPFGSMIDAATARAITQLIGNSYYQLLVALEKNEISEDELGTKKGIQKLKQLIKKSES